MNAEGHDGRGATRAATAAGERGAVALTAVLSALLLTAGAAAALSAVGDLASAVARARTAADAAALAGAGASPLVTPGGGDPRRAAAEVAAANGGRLIGVDDDAWPLGYAVTVEVQPATRWIRRIVGPVRAGAVAGVRPAVGVGGGGA